MKILRVTLESGEMPPGVTGLIPDGSTKVDWRWMGEVFEDSADEILQNSIVVRNLPRSLVSDLLKLSNISSRIKPMKSEQQCCPASHSGMVQQTQQAINQFVGMLGNLYQLPHPQTPDLTIGV